MTDTVKGAQVHDPRTPENRIATLEAQVSSLMQSMASLQGEITLLRVDVDSVKFEAQEHKLGFVIDRSDGEAPSDIKGLAGLELEVLRATGDAAHPIAEVLDLMLCGILLNFPDDVLECFTEPTGRAGEHRVCVRVRGAVKTALAGCADNLASAFAHSAPPSSGER